MRQFVDLLKEKNLIKIIDEPVDIELEMAHIAYVEVKKQDSKAILFTQPICKRTNQHFNMPVLMNLFGNHSLVELILGDVEKIATSVEEIIKFKPPKSFQEALEWLPKLWHLNKAFPKRTKQRGLCQEMIHQGDAINLYSLPILKTWEKDAAAFITMGQLYTQSLDGGIQNLGMYRLQVFNKKELGLHWQIHKDSMHLFEEYRKNGQKMPVSVAIGGDPLYTWCATAPLPYGLFELLLYGYIRKQKAKLVPCISNPLYVPFDADIVIEGFVDVNRLENEGPFGDHTGFYTPIEPYPVLEVSTITHKQNPIYLATVVGKPPLEDKYLGYPTERIFLPLLRTTAPQLIDYYMPENGVFHNLILAKIAPHYPSHAQQIMHALWGVGQMSFVKHALFVGENAPDLRDAKAITTYILKRLSTQNLLISEGICDALDHASEHFAKGGKLGVDCTGDEVLNDVEILSDGELLNKLTILMPEAVKLHQIFTDTPNPITLIGVQKKDQPITECFKALEPLKQYLRVVVCLDYSKLDAENFYMTLWRVVNSIDAKRDIRILEKMICIDSTDKGKLEGYTRQWPLETNCNAEVIADLRARKLIDIDDAFLDYFQILK
ncbi:menaquinone biosynthesis decarboxylase [Helicobacter monodelphidis]|uniref:menaquinone biosynthesis decarboxylase n=1 Tax=Helicobacter sp. 15-1451 TaxID=2004995 RepID=UPI000DCF1E56|nr:menaquinone biosynthesis decarboxylase [Helicobacter sp. 15-1451]RAX58868.1 menaquinone biosynthesis decarboxylase [Helicobacter sp. 15-1451]